MYNFTKKAKAAPTLREVTQEIEKYLLETESIENLTVNKWMRIYLSVILCQYMEAECNISYLKESLRNTDLLKYVSGIDKKIIRNQHLYSST